MRTATLLRERVSPSGARQLVVRLSEPLEGHEHVVVCAVTVCGDPEVFIFPADPAGVVTSWGELEGSLRGTLDHERALAAAGYVLVRQQ
ncbi:MAG TPA: hypothetical protein VJP77_09875 [Planctomycetota bacterium]|nr:hypothetical protein [Planctomycetota bacterium]